MHERNLDWILLIGVFLLLAVGLLALFSVSTVNGSLNLDHFYRQLLAVAIGISLLFFLSGYDYRALIAYSTRLYLAALIILLLVLFLGITNRGTSGWIGLFNLNFQPVELVKIIMIIFLASFLSQKKKELSTFSKMAGSFIMAAIPIFLVVRQPDFGSAMVIAGIWLGMLLVARVDRKSLFFLLAVFLIAVSISPFYFKTYQKERLINFIRPENDPKGSGYNVLQSIVAVGSGGLWGKGLGHGSQSQLNFIPEKHTDFIFAVIAEELGLFGVLVILFLFGLVFYRLKEIARLARDEFGYLLVVGIILMFFLQVSVNIGMNIGLVPVAGLPLPLLSYGGSSLVSIFLAIGLVQSVYRRKLKNLD